MKQSLYDQMLQYSTEPRWFVWPDGLLTASQSRPTREELIEGYMRIPAYVVTRGANGKLVRSERTFATREQAERAAAPYAIPQVTENAA
jgi:hypothetical protein